MSDPLVSVENLKTYFYTDSGVVKAVDDVSLTIPRGKTLGLVGESGCGKSVTAMSIIRLISPPGRIAGGRITMHGGADGKATAAGANAAAAAHGGAAGSGKTESSVVLSELPEREMRQVRGARISMIFQEPMTSLNPVFTIGAQIMEAITLHQKVGKHEARDRAIEMLRKVKIPEPERRIKDYPHQFSGGMRQRAMIAMALSCTPELLIADEPTTALDVTIQAQILDLLRELQAEVGMSILMITHDLGIVAEMADDVAVMYASKVVEYAPVAELFAHPLHPYTAGLFNSRPEPGKPKEEKLNTIPGMVPSPLRFPSGCKFHPRCAFSQQVCEQDEPALREIRPGHFARCHFAGELDFSRKPLA
jgi:peptide/nickel transport system ATP-binding protein